MATKSPSAAPAKKANVFKKAAAAVTPTAKGNPKATNWVVNGDNTELAEIETAISEIVDTQGELETLKNRNKLAANTIQKFAERRYIETYAGIGVPPETPMTVTNSKGQKVTFVVQDRSGQHAVKEGQVQDLIDLLGEDEANKQLVRRDMFSFDPSVLTESNFEAVTEAISDTLSKLVEKGKLTQEQMDNMIAVKSVTKFTPGIADRIGIICHNNVPQMHRLIEVLDAALTRYVKA